MDWAVQRDRMVDQQIVTRGIKDPAVLAAMRKVQRHRFVPKEEQVHSYDDCPLPIWEGQTISQPQIVAYMTEAARLTKKSKVLEIGTGSGYQTAVLAEIAGEIFSMEIIRRLAESARERLAVLGYINIQVRYGDGYQGWPDKSPFDAIIVTAASPEIPQVIFQQLKEGGWLVIPVGVGFQYLQIVTKKNGQMQITESLSVKFVPMVHG